MNSSHPLSPGERELVEQTLSTEQDRANLAGLLRLGTRRDAQDVTLSHPVPTPLPDYVARIVNDENSLDAPLLPPADTADTDTPAPVDWRLIADSLPVALLGLAAACLAGFVIGPTLLGLHGTDLHETLANIVWWPLLGSLIGIGWTAWKADYHGHAALFALITILITTWY